jgi:hypothetical protein
MLLQRLNLIKALTQIDPHLLVAEGSRFKSAL